MDQAKIDRINELAKKKKTVGLTEAEIEERGRLREEYLLAVRHRLTDQLDNIYIVDNKGNKRKLHRED